MEGHHPKKTRNRWNAGWIALCLGVLVSSGSAFGATVDGLPPGGWLITPQEASLPNVPPEMLEPGAPFDIGREAIDTGPVIEVVKPQTEEAATMPLEVLVSFVSRGPQVDVSTLRVTVVKWISFDITDRVIPYTTPRGIHIPDAKLPSGAHTVRISIGDIDGGLSQKQMTMIVP